MKLLASSIWFQQLSKERRMRTSVHKNNSQDTLLRVTQVIIHKQNSKMWVVLPLIQIAQILTKEPIKSMVVNSSNKTQLP
jgi:hypothetical protein